MKIGILSFHDSRNYGAILQIYALKKTLEKFDVEVSIIDYSVIENEFCFSLDKEIKNKGLILGVAKYGFYKLFVKKAMNSKRQKFLDFTKKYLNLSMRYNSINEFEQKNDFDIIICGSDQIWNPEITKGFDRMMFCDLQNKRIKKYSYAASVGDVKIIDTVKYKKDFFELIENFDKVSVREKELGEFINKNSNIKPIVTLDPTLLLNAEEYDLIEDIRTHNQKYILIYQLARYDKSIEIAKTLSKEKDLKIIEIVNNPYLIKRNKYMEFDTSVPEFLDLFKNAEYVITNSFHGTVFSIIFRKNFYTIASRTRNSRIINLLNVLNLNDRLLLEDNNDFTRESINYDEVNQLIEKERKISIEYLRDIIEREKNE